jgi:hypothetical protein
MKTFKEYITEAGGEGAGKMELVSTPYPKAVKHAEKLFTDSGKSFEKEIPNFDKNYKIAQKQANLGYTQRKDMPVIDTSDVKKLQAKLKSGFIDVNAPHAPVTSNANPFPEGLSGEDALKFLKAGLDDGSKTDDKVKVLLKKVQVSKLKPIQKQIYFDKSIGSTAEFGADVTKGFLESKSIFIASSDLYIIDGHHRYLSGMLVDPKMKVKVLVIDLPIKDLLPMTLAYGDAIGNKRNA